MIMVRFWAGIVCLFILVWPLTAPLAGEHAKILVSIEAQKFYVRTIAGIDPVVLIPKGYDPHTFEPRPGQLKEIEGIELYLTLGLPEEVAWAKKISAVNPRIKVADTSPLQKASKGQREERKHAHHHGDDPHTWLCPKLGEEIATKTYQALTAMYPERSKEYEKGLSECLNALRSFGAKIRDMLSSCQQRRFLVYHPAYGHFAEEFGLVQMAIEKEGKEPKAKDLMRLKEQIKTYQITKMIVQPGVGSRKQKALAERLGLVPVEIDPTAENWMDELNKLVRSMCELQN